MEADILIKNARYVVTMDAARRVIRDGAVAITGSRITAVDKTAALAAVRAGRIIDASGQIVMPGMINGHFHTNQQLSRGLADNVFLPTFIHERIYPFEASMSAEDIHVAALCACVEAIKTGTTCFADPGGYHMDQVARAVEITGIRAVLSRSMIDIHTAGRPIPGRMREDTEAALAAGEEFVSRFNGQAGGRIRAWFSIRIERAASDELCRRTKALADRWGVGVQSHVSGNPDSVNRHKEVFRGETPLVRYHRVGLLGPNLLIVHANHLTDEEIELVKKHDVKIVYCPTAAFAGGYGGVRARHPELVRQGVTVCVGSDAAPESNFNDMFRVMYCLAAHRDAKLDATLVPPETMLEMVITNGARALLWDDEIGSLEPGKKADLIILDTERPEWTPLLNPISNIAHAACGDSVNTVLVDGRVVMENRRILTVDEKAVLAKGQEVAEQVVERAGLGRFAVPAWPVL